MDGVLEPMAAFILVVTALVFSPGSVASAQQGVPDKPEGLTGRLLQFGSAELDWKDVQGAETYEAQYWDNNDGSNNFWADPPSVEYDGLLCGVERSPDSRAQLGRAV